MGLLTNKSFLVFANDIIYARSSSLESAKRLLRNLEKKHPTKVFEVYNLEGKKVYPLGLKV
jgi:hypothetical protein